MNSKTPTRRRISTRDLTQGATLILCGFEPQSMYIRNGSLYLEFEDGPDVQSLLDAYLLDKVRVPPRALVSLLRDLKSRYRNGEVQYYKEGTDEHQDQSHPTIPR